MANRTTRPVRTTRPTNQPKRQVKRSQGKSKKGLLVGLLALLLLVVAGIVSYFIITDGPAPFNRVTLDKYVEAQGVDKQLNDSVAVYIDLSDGMLSAYKDETHKKVLKSLINKMAADDAIDFFTLSSGEIEPRDMSHTELFNFVLDVRNYEKKWSAPIEETLRTIVDKKQPAILMSDFEEYNNGQIQRAAYAKRYLIDWLEMGYNVIFYKWNFVENGINKSMFIAVFDDNYMRLNSRVATAVDSYFSDEDKFVLTGREFTFPTYVSYNTTNNGGVYRIDGNDVVTNLQSEQNSQDYICYASPESTPSGMGAYSNLTQLVGDMAEYYPFGVSWVSAIKNMNDYKAGQDNERFKPFKHLLQGLYVDFKAQDGYSIKDVELRVFNISPILDKVAAKLEKQQTITMEDVDAWDECGFEVFNMLQVSKGESDLAESNAIPLYIDVHKQFDGTFSRGEESDVLRANIVISDVDVRHNEVEEFFAWDGNTCLSDSVIEALEAHTSNPIGKVIYTYYFKALEE